MKIAPVSRGQAFKVDALAHATVSVVCVEVDRGVQAMAETVDVGGVGVDVLAQRVRMLEELAEGFGIVGGLEGTCGGEGCVGFASWPGGLVGGGRA